MAKSLPKKAKVGTPSKTVSIDTSVYFTAKRMEGAGVLRRGQALMLAATLKTVKPKGAKK